jgi:hypothetical protein
MSGYLLHAQVLSNLLLGDRAPDEAVKRWLAANGDADFFVSEIAVGQLLSMVRKRGEYTDDERSAWLDALLVRVPREFSGRYIRMCRDVIDEWSRFRFEAAEGEDVLSTVQGLDLAVARFHSLIYACRPTRTIMKHHSEVVDPWS